jgi:lysophospholipase L1-like esterase
MAYNSHVIENSIMMGSDQKTTKILCFGDSNTWGYIPGSDEQRYPANIRWTGVLQGLLGKKYLVQEEGLNGRITDLDDPKHPGKNGYVYFVDWLKSYGSISCLILMLGGNDLTKKRFSRKAEEVANGIEKIINFAREENNRLNIILINPPKENDKLYRTEINFQKNITHKFELLADKLRTAAQKYDCLFLDANEIVKISKMDGCHMTKGSHQKMAIILASKVRGFFN